MAEVLAKNSAKVSLIEQHDVIQTTPVYGTDHAFDEWIRSRRSRRGAKLETNWSVLIDSHDRQHPDRDRRIGRIWRMELKIPIVVVDLPVIVLIIDRESSHVVLTVGVDALIEPIVGADRIQDLSNCLST